ncbi:glucose-6-phosphate isomerase [Sulfurospirillum sp. 1612]|uniref:glucose-6-phosphate isomerase n=1 Tax=Sulfurospirillum sp. 1612 TaxID=3094835 RepID=UPI002F950F03
MLKFDKQFKNKSAQSNEQIQDVIKILKDEMDTNAVGYYKLPSLSQEHIKTLEGLDFSKVSQIVVIGIGGSSLGIKAIDQILRPYSKTAKEMIFLENSDPVSISQNLNKIQKENACFFVISKSGSTIETTSIFKTLIKFCDIDLHLKADQQRVYAITDEGSALSDFAKANKILEFNIPENVGGRFSVLSAVGVVPLYIAGYDMAKVLQGAGAFVERFFNGEETHLIEKASYLVQQATHTPINVLFSYADRLEHFTKWYVQLWAESLGKVDKKGKHVGLTPVGLIGAVDQHSFLQLIIEGPRDKCVTFIKIDDFKADLSIPDITLKGIEKTNFINKKKFNLLINAQCDATMQSLIDTKVDTDIITIDCVTPENVGALIMYFELLTSVAGIKLNINTYDQPGVELGKQILYKNLQIN